MRLLALAPLFAALITSAAATKPESVEEAAVLARTLVDSEDSIGTLATTFPDTHPELPGRPFALMEYYASCARNGSLSFIFMPISQNSRNILSSPEHAATITVRAHPARASNARVALIGNVTVFDEGHELAEEQAKKLVDCFTERHPDAKWWLPGRKPAPHRAFWARFDPHSIYYVGGFGNEHYIGYIPINLYTEAVPPGVEAHTVMGGLLVQAAN